jgi:hypothetical protein
MSWWQRLFRRRGRPAPPTPRETTIRSHHVWITTQPAGLVVRRRAGLTGWMPVCSLDWYDIVALELDSGTPDGARMLYASTRNSRTRKPLIDQTHLTSEQWVLLRDSVAAWTAQGVWIDLAPLSVTDRSRPYDGP